MECPEDPGCDSKSALCPCVKGDKTMDPCPYALLFSYSAQRQLSNLLKDDGIDVDEKIRKLSAATKKLDDLAEALAPTPSADGRRSLLFGPLPPRDPCGQGFDPSCEQAQGFGMCSRADVWAACNVTRAPRIWTHRSRHIACTERTSHSSRPISPSRSSARPAT